MKIRLSLFLFALFAGSTFAADAPASVADLFATPEILQLVRTADKIDACILNHIAATPRADGSIDRSTERFEETVFVALPPAIIDSLRTLLLNGKTYDWKASGGGRRPPFHLRLRFQRDTEIVSLDFCFKCHVLGVSHQGTELGHANFLPNSDLIVAAFLKIFPSDEMLNRLAKEAGLPL